MSKWVYPHDFECHKRMEERYARMGIRKVGFFKSLLLRVLAWLDRKI